MDTDYLEGGLATQKTRPPLLRNSFCENFFADLCQQMYLSGQQTKIRPPQSLIPGNLTFGNLFRQF